MNRIISAAILVFAFITLVLTLSKGFVRKKIQKRIVEKDTEHSDEAEQVWEAYLEERRKQEANWCCIEAGLLVLSLICAVSDSLQIPRLLFMIAAAVASGMAFWLNIRFGESSDKKL